MSVNLGSRDEGLPHLQLRRQHHKIRIGARFEFAFRPCAERSRRVRARHCDCFVQRNLHLIHGDAEKIDHSGRAPGQSGTIMLPKGFGVLFESIPLEVRSAIAALVARS